MMKILVYLSLVLPIAAVAEDWRTIDDPERLTDLMSDTVMEATLTDGVKASAEYKSDGTGLLKAWGETFERRWEVTKNDRVCIIQEQTTTCYRIESNTEDNKQYRIENLTTGEKVVTTISKEDDGPLAVESANPNAGGAAKPSAEEIAAKLANPNTPMATMTLKLQQRSFEGDLPNAGDQNSTTLLLQPVLPFKVGEGQIFFRPALSVIAGQPVFNSSLGDFDEEDGFGDFAFDLAYGETTESGLLWAAGLISSLPIGSDGISSDLYTLGPEFLIGKLTPKWVIGAFPNHQWDIGGSGEGDVNLTTVQLFGTIIGGGGWTYGTAPVMTYDQNTSQWTTPINLTVGKTVITKGGRPWKLGLEINYYAENADPFGPEWMIGFSIAPVIENPLAKWFR